MEDKDLEMPEAAEETAVQPARLKEERAQNGRAYNQEDTRAEPACGGLGGIGVSCTEFAVHLDASDKPDDRADGVDEFRCRVKIGSDHAGGFGDARHAVALGER